MRRQKLCRLLAVYFPLRALKNSPQRKPLPQPTSRIRVPRLNWPAIASTCGIKCACMCASAALENLYFWYVSFKSGAIDVSIPEDRSFAAAARSAKPDESAALRSHRFLQNARLPRQRSGGNQENSRLDRWPKGGPI